jgi:hypothetical protein
MEAERGMCLRINAPEWFKRDDFAEWLSSDKTATWHEKGTIPGEYSDVFVTIDGDEGSDAWQGPSSDTIPKDIWAEIVAAAKRLGINDGIVWISNVEVQ